MPDTPTFPEDLASRVARLEEARNDGIEARESGIEAFAEESKRQVERLESALAEIDRSLEASGF
jgi:hypothetical protein